MRPLCMSYNGEIYNFIELRAELEALGVLFSTDSDTEVLLQCWIRWRGTTQKLNGMFALYADLRASSHSRRDRFGVKPLYYSIEKISFLGHRRRVLPKSLEQNPT